MDKKSATFLLFWAALKSAPDILVCCCSLAIPRLLTARWGEMNLAAGHPRAVQKRLKTNTGSKNQIILSHFYRYHSERYSKQTKQKRYRGVL